MRRRYGIVPAVLAYLALTACGGGSGGSTVGTDTTAGNCSGSCATPAAFLSVADVEQIIAQAVGEANALGVGATIAVVDRVGNVLAVFRMSAQTVQIATATDSSHRVSTPCSTKARRSSSRSPRNRSAARALVSPPTFRSRVVTWW